MTGALHNQAGRRSGFRRPSPERRRRTPLAFVAADWPPRHWYSRSWNIVPPLPAVGSSNG